MSLSVKKTLHLLGVAIAAAVVSLAFLPGSSGSGPYASTLDDPESGTPVMGPACDHTQCNTACWVDGCVHNAQTECVRTVKQPINCPPETGGCVTRAC